MYERTGHQDGYIGAELFTAPRRPWQHSSANMCFPNDKELSLEMPFVITQSKQSQTESCFPKTWVSCWRLLQSQYLQEQIYSESHKAQIPRQRLGISNREWKLLRMIRTTKMHLLWWQRAPATKLSTAKYLLGTPIFQHHTYGANLLHPNDLEEQTLLLQGCISY